VGYSCESTCSYNQKCCGDGSCCGKDLKCCGDGVCEPPCELVEGENCEAPLPPYPEPSDCSAMSCAIGDICSRPGINIIWSGVTERTCNPVGCPGDCDEDITWCWKGYRCVRSGNYELFATCSDQHCVPLVGCNPKGFFSCESVAPIPTKCYICEQSSEGLEVHYVKTDSCN
jgi:hypothetical protein